MNTGFYKLAAICALLSPAAYAQSTFASITGVCADPAGALVPGAVIEATNIQTNYVYRGTSNEVGQYTLPNLLDGQYKLKAAAAGFDEFTVQEFTLTTREVRRIDIQFKIGAVGATVEVTAGVSLIDTESSRIADVKDRDQLRVLPLTTRRAWDFFHLSPNVSKQGGGWNIRFAGSRTNQGEVTLDGASIAQSNGNPSLAPLLDNTEGYQELRIDMAGNPAEFGTVGQVSVITRSGTNEFHGTAFDYYQTPGFQARDFFALESTSTVTHKMGTAAGGPVYLPKLYNGRNRTFIFATVEWTQSPMERRNLDPTVPLAAWRTGDFSRLAPGTVIRDPFAGNAPFAGNRIPASRLNPVAQKIQDRFYPLPNWGDPNVLISQNYREIVMAPVFRNPLITSRLDHRFGDKAFVFARVNYVDRQVNQQQGNLPTIGPRKANRVMSNWAVSYTQNVRPTLVNEFRLSLTSQNFPAEGPVQGKEMIEKFGLQGLAPNLPDVSGIYTLRWSNIGLTGLAQQNSCGPKCSNNLTYQGQDLLSWFSGRHSVKTGIMMVRYRQISEGQTDALFGAHTFSNRFTGHPYADFLLGIPTTANRDYPGVLSDRNRWTTAWFAQDEFKISPRVTLNLGLRYEYMPGWTEATGQQAVFDIPSGKIAVPDGAIKLVSALVPKDYVDVVEAKSLGLPGNTLVRADRNNFAPRFGVAWRPLGNNTVFRGGFGIYYDITPKGPTGGSVFSIREPAFTNPTTNPSIILPLIFPTSVAGPTSINLPQAVQADIRVPYSMQYNLTVEHQQWDTGFRLSYIGTNTRQGVYTYNYNQPVGDTRAYIDKARPFMKYPAVTYATNGGGHQYNAVSVEVEKRTGKGLTAQIYYTLARDIGDLDDNESPEDSFDRRRERAVWGDIPTHRTVANLTYELPFGKGKPLLSNGGRLLNGLFGGWQLSSIFSYDSGSFLTPMWTGPDPTGTRQTATRTPASATLRPNHLRDANLSTRTVAHWFDISAFGAPAAGSFGTSAKGVVKGPGANVLHASLAKHFTLRERLKLRLEMLATNALNHPNFADPNMNITDLATAGVIGRTVDVIGVPQSAGVRTAQLLLRLTW